MAHAQQGLSLVSYGLIFEAASMILMSMASTFDQLLSKKKSNLDQFPMYGHSIQICILKMKNLTTFLNVLTIRSMFCFRHTA
jgi:hypothetical protein